MEAASAHLYIEFQHSAHKPAIKKAAMFLWRIAMAVGFGMPTDLTAILLVRRRDDDSSVHRQTYFADFAGATVASESMQSDLDGMTLDSFCEKYGIEYKPTIGES
jgi:hypothetical protein